MSAKKVIIVLPDCLLLFLMRQESVVVDLKLPDVVLLLAISGVGVEIFGISVTFRQLINARSQTHNSSVQGRQS